MVQKNICLFKTIHFKAKLFVFFLSFFLSFYSWHDGVQKTFCFLTLARQQFVIAGNSIICTESASMDFQGLGEAAQF